MLEFDKRTSLGIAKAFPTAVHSDKLLAGNIAKDVCAQMSQELVSVVPQLNDYLCPVCFSVAYRPIRLDCQHVFCIRCVIKIQRRREKHCPLCRADVVMEASAGESTLRHRGHYIIVYVTESCNQQTISTTNWKSTCGNTLPRRSKRSSVLMTSSAASRITVQAIPTRNAALCEARNHQLSFERH